MGEREHPGGQQDRHPSARSCICRLAASTSTTLKGRTRRAGRTSAKYLANQRTNSLRNTPRASRTALLRSLIAPHARARAVHEAPLPLKGMDLSLPGRAVWPAGRFEALPSLGKATRCCELAGAADSGPSSRQCARRRLMADCAEAACRIGTNASEPVADG